MLAGVDPELLEFCSPWLAREPRLLLACQFAPAGSARARFLASCTVAREFAESALAVSDRRVAEARLAWWAEEAAGWSRGQPRHPLARGFEPAAAAQALAAMATAASRWLDAPPAAAIGGVLEHLGALGDASAGLAGAGSKAAWELQWLALAVRLSLQASAPLASVLPLDLMARHALRRSQWPELDTARRLSVLADLLQRAAVAPAPSGDPPLAALVALERRWLQRMAKPAADRIGIADAFVAWRAARRAAAG